MAHIKHRTATVLATGMSMLLTLGMSVGLSACADDQKVAAVSATVTTDTATVIAKANQAITFVGVAEGIANIAAANNEDLKAKVTAYEAKIDPIVAAAKIAVASATVDVPALESLAIEINAEAVELTNQTATVVKVVASK